MKPLHILYIVPYAPTRIRTRPHHLLKQLAARGHHLTLATVWQTPAERAALDKMAELGIAVRAFPLSRIRTLRNMVNALPATEPLQAAYAWHPILAASIRSLTQPAPHEPVCAEPPIDLVHIEHLRGARYALDLNTRVPVLWDSVDCISHLFAQAQTRAASRLSRLWTKLELSRTRKHEAALVRRFDRVLVTSAADRAALLALDNSPPRTCPPPVHVLTNGVTLPPLSHDLSISSRADSHPTAPPARQPDTLVFSGKLSYHANVTAAQHFVRTILPLIWRARPDTRLWIVGQGAPRAVLALGADPRITLTGAVPDPAPYLAQASLAVCPVLYGAGVQNKILEAMAHATTVVAYANALSSLTACPGTDLLAAATPPEFAAQVLRLLADPVLAQQIGQSGRRYVERAHAWPDITTQLEQHYVETIAAKTRRENSTES